MSYKAHCNSCGLLGHYGERYNAEEHASTHARDHNHDTHVEEVDDD
jgi:hypothetical protein